MTTKFNRFDEIQHRPLKIFNRSVMMFNILESHGKQPMIDYIESFTKEERLEIAQMVALTKKLGRKRVVDMVTAGVDFVDEPYTEAV